MTQIPHREIIYANGVTFYWHKDDVTGGDIVGIEATEQGYRFLETQAKQQGKTVDKFINEVLVDAFQSAGVKLDLASYTSGRGSPAGRR